MGPADLTLWTAMKDFDTSKGGCARGIGTLPKHFPAIFEQCQGEGAGEATTLEVGPAIGRAIFHTLRPGNYLAVAKFIPGPEDLDQETLFAGISVGAVQAQKVKQKTIKVVEVTGVTDEKPAPGKFRKAEEEASEAGGPAQGKKKKK